MRTTLIMLAAAAALNAQPEGRGPRPGGPGGPGDARFIGARPGMPGRTVKNAPYSADMITETSQALADGNRIRRTSTSRIYRDSEGRTRREQSLDGLNSLAAASNLPQVVFISDPVAGADFALNTRDKTATKTVRQRPPGSGARGLSREGGQAAADRPVRPEPSSRRADPNQKTESLGRQLMEGVPVEGTRNTLTIPAGRIGNDQPIVVVTETWYSAELQTMVLSKRSDPRSGETIFKLANVSRAEPPRTMFDVPVEYKVSETSRGRSAFGPPRK